MEDQTSNKALTSAALSLLGWSMLSAVALVAWFSRNPAPWGWKSLLATICAVLGVLTSMLLWKVPTRANAILGIVIMLASLARIGGPSEWTWVSFTLVAITFLLLMPLVNAAMVLRS